MIRKSIKYLVIALINLIILTVLLAYWTDFVELTFNSYVRPIEFLKIIGFTLLSLIGIRIAIGFFRKRNTSFKKRIQISTLITILVSSFLYFNYSKMIYKNRIQNRELRKELALKIEPVNILAFGTKADNLTFEEYEEITQINWFPKLQKKADSISYVYTYDGFLSDYSFYVSYIIPNTIEIDSTEIKYGKIEVDTIGNKFRINYSEYLD
jgi:DNA-binding Xre family transcriptional regulator